MPPELSNQEMIEHYRLHLREYQYGQWNHGFFAGLCGGFIIGAMLIGGIWIVLS